MPRSETVSLTEFNVKDIDAPIKDVEEFLRLLKSGERPTVCVNSRGRPILSYDRALLAAYYRLDRGIQVPVWKEAPVETMDRERKEEEAKSKAFQEWAKTADLLVKVQLSPRRFIVTNVKPFAQKLSGYPHGRVYRNGEVVYGPDTEEACDQYIRDAGITAPEKL